MKITKKALLSNPELLRVYLNSENIHYDYSDNVCDMFYEHLEKIVPFLATIISEVDFKGSVFNEPTNCWLIIKYKRDFLDKERISFTFKESVKQEEKEKLTNLILDYQKQHNLPLLNITK